MLLLSSKKTIMGIIIGNYIVINMYYPITTNMYNLNHYLYNLVKIKHELEKPFTLNAAISAPGGT